MQKEKFEGFIASLSNGETCFEEWVTGELSPWRRLLNRLEDEPGLAVTQLRLQAQGRTYCCIPHADAYFQAHKASSSMMGKSGFMRGVGSIVGDKVYILWVNEQGDCWQEVRPA